MIDTVQNALGPWWLPVWTVAKIVVIAIPLIIAVAYLTYAERKVIGWIRSASVRIASGRSVSCSPSPTC